MLVTSRSFAEYVAFFGLDPDRLADTARAGSLGGSAMVADHRDRFTF